MAGPPFALKKKEKQKTKNKKTRAHTHKQTKRTKKQKQNNGKEELQDRFREISNFEQTKSVMKEQADQN